MKQTNNAIKFLMAQYRAIFQNAYFKGLATAAVVTMGLAAGQAQAASAFTGTVAPDNKTTIAIDGTAYTALTITDTSANKDYSKQNFVISTGATSANSIKGSTADVEFKVNDLTISGSAPTVGLDVAGVDAKGDAKLTANTINIVTGTLKTTLDTSKVGKIHAGSITIGKKDLTADQAILELADKSSVGTIGAKAAENSKITLNDGALIKTASGASLTGTDISGGTLTINGGHINAAGDGTTNITKLNITVVDGSMNGGKITTAKGDALKLAFTATDVKDSSNNSVAKEFAINKGEIIAAGTITLTGQGTFSLADEAKITSGAALGEFKVSGADADNLTTLSLSKTALDNLAKNTKVSTENAVLDITGNDQIILGTNKNLTFANSSAAQNQILAGSDTTLKAVNVKVDGAVSDGGDVTVDATNLTLAGTEASTLGGLKAQNVTFEATGTDPYKLQEGLTLSAVSKNGEEYTAQQGSITGDVVVSGTKPLLVDGGIYSANSIKLDKGLLNVGSATSLANTELTLSNLTLDNTNGANTITVTGKKGAEAVLQLDSNAQLSLVGSNDQDKVSKIEVKDKGTLSLTGDQVSHFLNNANWGSNNKSGGTIYINGGKVDTLDTDLTLDASVLANAANDDAAAKGDYKIYFAKSASGKLHTQNLKLTDTTGNGLSFGDATNNQSIIRVHDTLNVHAQAASGNFAVKTGQLVVHQNLISENNSSLTLGADSSSSAHLTLGELNVENGAAVHSADQGTVGINLNFVGNSGTDKDLFKINYGTWTAKDISAKNTLVTVGYDLTNPKKAANAKFDHKWGLDADKLVLDTGANVTVYQNIANSTQAQELVVDNLDMKAGSKIALNGDMTLNGKDNSATTPTDFGVKIADADAITVNQGASLTITDAALKAITISGDNVTLNGYADGSIESTTGSTVKLAFADDYGVISDKALQELRKKLFGLGDTAKLAGTLSIGGAQISGLEVTDGEIAWDKVATNKDVVTDVTNDALTNAKVTGVESGDAVRGTFGSMTSTTLDSKFNGQITTDERLTLGNAAANDGYFAAQVKVDKDGKETEKVGALGFKVGVNSDLTLVNGGKAGNITLGNASGLVVDSKAGVTELTQVSGDGTSKLSLQSGKLSVVNDKKNASIKVGTFNSAAGSTLQANNLELSNADKVAKIAGNLEVTGRTTFAGDTELSGKNTLATVSFAKEASILGGSTAATEVTLKSGLNINGSGELTADVLKAAGTSVIKVGKAANETAKTEGSNGLLSVGRLDLAGGTLVVDPEFTDASSFAGVDKFGSNDKDKDAGIVNGEVYALQNAIVSIGNKNESEVKPIFNQFVEADGSLQDPTVKGNENGVGAIAYVAKKVQLGSTSKIVIDPHATEATYNQANYAGDLYIGSNAGLAVDISALADSSKAAITFDKAAATVYAKDSANSKIYITGNISDLKDDKINLFGSTQNTGTVTLDVESGTTLTVQTLNGLFFKDLQEGNIKGDIGELTFNAQLADKQFSVVSEPVKNTLISLGHGYNDYTADQPSDDIIGITTDVYATDDGRTFYKASDETKTPITQSDEYYGKLDSIQKDGQYVVFVKDHNDLLNNILVNGGNAVDAETVARLAVFGGAPQAAIEAGASTYEAISARMGVGVSGVSAAANGQGGAIWVTPVYKSADADGFAADNKSYGSDVTLYGLALGADIEVAPHFKVGGMFNVGSGDADGQGLGANVSNDFDYYGLGLYAGYSIDAFSLVADITYTAVDNDIEGNTDLGKVTTSIDSTNLSVGVTGQYKLSVAGMDVTPHAGVRFSKLDIDDYATEYAQSSSDSLNIFSVPVGVTIAKEYVIDTWTVKPSFDLTLTGNFGDDEFEGNAQWATFSNLSTNVKSEIMDNFTYGAAVGVSATSGNFGLGLGVNYTGSSNTDEFGVNANARYMF